MRAMSMVGGRGQTEFGIPKALNIASRPATLFRYIQEGDESPKLAAHRG